jgi:dissimilatory sulfite reductase (desulfoviridin) alpha/beta subunit
MAWALWNTIVSQPVHYIRHFADTISVDGWEQFLSMVSLFVLQEERADHIVFFGMSPTFIVKEQSLTSSGCMWGMSKLRFLC